MGSSQDGQGPTKRCFEEAEPRWRVSIDAMSFFGGHCFIDTTAFLAVTTVLLVVSGRLARGAPEVASSVESQTRLQF